MTRLIKEEDILKHAKDVTLANGAKHRCFDVTLLSELPNVYPLSCEGCVRDNDFRWEDECFECARYFHDWYKRKEE